MCTIYLGHTWLLFAFIQVIHLQSYSFFIKKNMRCNSVEDSFERCDHRCPESYKTWHQSGYLGDCQSTGVYIERWLKTLSPWNRLQFIIINVKIKPYSLCFDTWRFHFPIYLFQETEELVDVQDEFKFDRTTKIPRKEVDILINEIITAYDLDEVRI